ncbi:MAG: ATP-binding protein [Bacteroidales bacterium]|nr:ATP-binding protein [Bacteroidales bacterium]
MRYLNKIIFINSAHVPYAEIQLDGNVHFIGTQGVGKSTLLRAILFFYNGDKMKLGIRTQDKQKNYDDFYLPYPNSYIIYEVCRENGSFCVLSFISKGRTAFRIIDCAYDRRFFIDSEGMARSEWGRISEAIGHKIFKSNIIHNYEEFRDIIYGNKQNIANKELHRFCILESSKYQNVPRTIQNIFLNQSLESRVIKDTIIDSMDFSSDGIDLHRYREHLKSFSQQYEDIWKWYKKEKNGTVKVKAEACEVINSYSLFDNLMRGIAELCAEVNYAYDRDRELQPKLDEESDTKTQDLERQRRLLSEEKGKHDKELASLYQTLGAVNEFLEKVQEKRTHYASINIEEIVRRIHQEGELKIRLDSLTKEENLLTSTTQNVKEKYDHLGQNITNELRQYELQTEAQKNVIDGELNGTLSKITSNSDTQKNEIEQRYQQLTEENAQQLDNAKAERTQILLDENTTKSANPYAAQIDELNSKIDALKAELNEKTKEEAQLSQRIQNLEHDIKTKDAELQAACEKEVLQIENEIKSVENEISKLTELLNRQKDSLIEWLDGNVKDWEQTVGKVLDEEQVLFNTRLSPTKADTSDALFGIRINLEEIDREVRTPKMIAAQRTDFEGKKQALEQTILARKKRMEEEINAYSKKLMAETKRLRGEKLQVSTRLGIIPQTITSQQEQLAQWNVQLETWRTNRLKELSDKRAQTNKTIEALEKTRQELFSKKEAELKKTAKQRKDAEKDAKENATRQKQALEERLCAKRQEAEDQQRELLAQMDAELKGLGVDVRQLELIRSKKAEIEAELRYINDHRNEYVGWQNDTRDYFSQEQAKRNELKNTKLQIDELKKKFDLREKRYNQTIATLSSEISNLRQQVQKISKMIEKVDGLKQSASCPEELLADNRSETTQTLEHLYGQLDSNIRDKSKRYEDFRSAVDAFKRNFSGQNTFNFRTELQGERDYLDFAIDLHEFISNNKIEEYRARTSERYASIIQQISKEVGDISQHSADIKATINEINRDFQENNFAGVIKEIELRAVESNDRMMQQLLNIKKFDEENGMNVGEMNLFTDEDSRKETNSRAVSLLMHFIDLMSADSKRDHITLSDTFKLEFRVKENDQDTGWVEKLSNVGSDGTDILVKAMVNIMLINVFKRKISRKFDDFQLHCMMDEIGKLHPDNVKGILKFANDRKILLINSSPTTYNARAYKYTYSLSKDAKSNTLVKTLLTVK